MKNVEFMMEGVKKHVEFMLECGETWEIYDVKCREHVEFIM